MPVLNALKNLVGRISRCSCMLQAHSTGQFSQLLRPPSACACPSRAACRGATALVARASRQQAAQLAPWQHSARTHSSLGLQQQAVHSAAPRPGTVGLGGSTLPHLGSTGFVQHIHTAAAAQADSRQHGAGSGQTSGHKQHSKGERGERGEHGQHGQHKRLKGRKLLQKIDQLRRKPSTTFQNYPQPQLPLQQQQWPQQHSPQQWPLPQPQQQQQQWQQRPVSDALKVTVTAVLHTMSRPYNGGWMIMRFKKVLKHTNAQPTNAGWVPVDEKQATADLQRGTYSSKQTKQSSQSSTSSRRASSSRDFAATAAKALLCVTGVPGPVREGKAYSITGLWDNHPHYGWQINLLTCTESLDDADPYSYLESLEGVGPVTAQRLVAGLGRDMQHIKQVLDLPLQQAVARLTQIDKIGPVNAKKIKLAWDKAQGPADVLGALQHKLGLSAQQANKVLARWEGQAAVGVVQQLQSNPYALLDVVPGYTLQQADALANSLGLDPGLPQRGAAYLLSSVRRSYRTQGQAGVPWQEVEVSTLQDLRSAKWPGWPPGQSLRQAAELLVLEEKLVIEEQRPLQLQQYPSGYQSEPLFEFEVMQLSWAADAVVYLKAAHAAEVDTVEYLLLMLQRCVQALANLQSQQQQQPSQSSPAAFTASDSLVLPDKISPEDVTAVQDLEEQLSLQLGKPVVFNSGQRMALVLPLMLPLLVVTGGPGCGKTLVSQGLARWYLDNNLDSDLFMAAPTGRAAQRMQEMLSEQHAEAAASSTLHRLLGYRNNKVVRRLATQAKAGEAGFEAVSLSADPASDEAGGDTDLGSLCEYNRDFPLRPGRYLVDEVSMADMALTAALFNALRAPSEVGKAPLTLVGDPDQLPPVSPGQPIADAIAERVLPCVDLREIYRTAKDSAIVASAHAVNKEVFPTFSAVWDINPSALALGIDEVGRHIAAAAAQGKSVALDSSAIMLRLPDSCTDSDVAAALQQAAQQLVPRLDCDPQRDVQVLSPIRRSDSAIGVNQLNTALQGLFNPPHPKKTVLQLNRFGRPGSLWREGDRVTHLKNNTQLDVYNGDQGYIHSINTEAQSVTVRYPRRFKRGGSSSGGSGFDTGDSSDDDDGGDAGRTYAADDGAYHLVTYVGDDINDMLELAWATTVHKAQGGEFPVVLLALHQVPCGQALKRQLLYTAISRAQQLLVVVGTDAALQRCLHTTGTLDAGSNRFRARLRSGRVQQNLPTIERLVWTGSNSE